MKLFWRIFFTVFMSFFIGILLISYLTSARQFTYAKKQLLYEKRIIGRILSDEIDEGYAQSQWPFHSLKKLSERKDFIFWWIVMGDGIIHLADNSSFIGTRAYDYFPQVAKAMWDKDIYVNDKKGYGIYVKFLEASKNKWSFWFGFSITDIYKMRRDIILSTVLFSLLILAPSGVAVYIIVENFTRPVKDLIIGAAEIGQGRLDYRIGVRSDDELGQLSNSFNNMAQELQKIIVSRDDLAREVAERKKIEERLSRINTCFLSFGTDPLENINHLTFLCGEVLEADCALYNRLEGNLICSIGRWNTPADYNPVDKPDGHICYDVIKQGGNDILLVSNLPETPYAQTDPNISRYKLKTYMGVVVKCKGRNIGSLCVVYQKDFVPTEEDKEFLSIIASAVGIEEERRQIEQELKEAYAELKNIQAQLVQSAKMAAVGELASGIAHEINNPLTGILNNIHLIILEAERKKDFNLNEFKGLLDIIKESVLKCAKITGSLLDFSHISTEEFQSVSINEIVEKVTTLIEEEMKLENIVIKREFASGLPKIFGDPQLIQQVIFDIISNARWAIKKKAKGEAGLITIKTQYQQRQRNVCVSISDTGIGIAKEDLDRIFEPFFTTKPVGEGTGLGLSIAYNIIKEHKGVIEVGSELDKGTTLKICFPAELI